MSMTSLTPQQPTSVVTSLVSMLVSKGLAVLAAGMVTHGWIANSQTEMVVSAGLLLLSLGWSTAKVFWDSYGRVIVMAQLEVLKAKALAQAEAMKKANVPPVTVRQIADKSATMNALDVAKVAQTLPPEVRANIVS